MRRKNSFSRQYRIVPIILASLIIFAVLSAVIVLIWSVVVYASKATVSDASALPAIIWLVILFISSALMTLLTRGGTVIPALLLTVITVILSAILAESGTVTAGGFVLKLLISAAVAVVAFTIAKIFVILSGKSPRPRRRRRQPAPAPQLFTNIDDDDPGFIEYKKH